MNKLKRRIDRACGKRTALHDSIFLDAMLPEFKAANAELLKAIKMNDKSGAIPYTELLEINKAMKENDADRAGQALKKVQAKLNKAEKALDEEIKTATAKLAESKKAREMALQALKAKKAVAQIFEKAKAACDSAKQSPKNASKLTALTDRIKEYGDLSKRVSQIVTMSASGKDISKQIDLLKKSIEAAEKKYKKDLAAIEQSAKRSKDELEKIADGQKIAQGKRDAFQKERLYLANVVKKMPLENKSQRIGGVSLINKELSAALQKGKRLYSDLENEKEELKRTYDEETGFYKDLKAKSKKNHADAVKRMKQAAKTVKNDFLSHKLLSIVDEFERDQYSFYPYNLSLLRYDWEEYSGKTKSKDEQKIYSGASKVCEKMLGIYDAFDDKRNDLAKNYKKASQMLTRPDLDPASRIRLFNKIKQDRLDFYRRQIIDMLPEFHKNLNKAPEKFADFEKIMKISAERKLEGFHDSNYGVKQ